MAPEPDETRLQRWLDELSSPDVGGTVAGGVSRPALGDYDKVVRDRLADILLKLNLAVRVDDVGNMYARREGTDATLAPVVIGSHLDTVVPGGRFDGILGIAVALETIASLNDSGIDTLRPIELVNWTGEEGARFSPAMLGSGLVVGAWDADYVHQRVDPDGNVLGDALREIGYLGNESSRLTRFHAALEVHIEQGMQLDGTDTDIGIVPSIGSVRWCTVEVRGSGGHAGGPGPDGRNEALVAAARMVVAARDAAVGFGDFKATVGRINVEPGSHNVIPHLVRFALDLRSASDEAIDRTQFSLTEIFETIATEERVTVHINFDWSLPGAQFDERIQRLLHRIADEQRVGWLQTPGFIGHDSLHLARMGPTAMIFVRSKGGVSHAENECAPWRSIVAAARIFVKAVPTLANEKSWPA